MGNTKNKWLVQWVVGGGNLDIEELIEKLTKLQLEHGNLEVVGMMMNCCGMLKFKSLY